MKVYRSRQFLTAIINFFLSPQKKKKKVKQIEKEDRLCIEFPMVSCLATYLQFNFWILNFQIVTSAVPGIIWFQY